MTNELREIYVKLLDEAVEVWRPAQAEQVGDGLFLIVAQPYDREAERWEFEPGARVACEMVEGADGRFLAAVRESRS